MASGWAESFDQLWRSPTLPMWLLLAVAGFLGLILLATLLRAERSIANGTLALLTVAAIAVAIAVLFRSGSSETAAPAPTTQNASSFPALACLDDLAGETVLTACEKTLFSTPDMAASAVAYTASQLSRLKSYGDVASANRAMTPDLEALRRAIERDRYGLVAYVLSVRERCKPDQCAAYASLTDHSQIAVNMTERTYEAAIDKYAQNWNAPPAAAGAASLMAPTQPTGKPTNADFPTASSIPPVSIMNPEPPASRPPAAVTAPAQPAAPRPAAAGSTPPPAAPKKQPAAPKKQAAPAPVQLSPAPSSTAPVDREP